MRLVFAAALLAAAGSAMAEPCKSLGVGLTNISHSLRESREIPDYVTGALVRVVYPRSLAEKAGLLPGDVVQGVGDRLVQNVCDVRAAVEKNGCREVRVTVRRGVDTFRFRVKPTEEPPRGTCKDGDGAACLELARANDNAKHLLKLACDLGNAEGCYDLALELGNTEEAAVAYEQACDGGNALACTNLGYMYEHGEGVAKDLEAGLRLFRKGCDGSACTGPNNLGCVNLGRAYRDGIGTPVDAVRAMGLFRDVCERTPVNEQDGQTIHRSCSLAGTIILFGKVPVRDVSRALSLLEKGCAAGDTFGCFNLGVLYEFGDEVTKDATRAAKYYARACERGDAEACQRGAALQ